MARGVQCKNVQLVFLAFQNQTACSLVVLGSCCLLSSLRPWCGLRSWFCLCLSVPSASLGLWMGLWGHRALVWGTAGAGREVDTVSLQKLQCRYQTALSFGLSKECTVQIAENRELGASMLHKTEVKTRTNVHSISSKDSIYSIHAAWSCF